MSRENYTFSIFNSIERSRYPVLFSARFQIQPSHYSISKVRLYDEGIFVNTYQNTFVMKSWNLNSWLILAKDKVQANYNLKTNYRKELVNHEEYEEFSVNFISSINYMPLNKYSYSIGVSTFYVDRKIESQKSIYSSVSPYGIVEYSGHQISQSLKLN